METPVNEILENIHDAVVTLDAEWRVTYLNHAAARFAGRPAAELVGDRRGTSSRMHAATSSITSCMARPQMDGGGSSNNIAPASIDGWRLTSTRRPAE